MANYLNLKDTQVNFSELKNSKLFVDKSNIIELLNEKINTADKYICVTKPRRFGKTSIVNMLSAYYTKNLDSKE
ncbi:MAG: AAA family ATPase, partial [Clostridium sp.]|uniref:AAA family ATPase n=1 Tax=Clostridium sp. TaxID=1506 RepID=UPI003F3141C0